MGSAELLSDIEETASRSASLASSKGSGHKNSVREPAVPEAGSPLLPRNQEFIQHGKSEERSAFKDGGTQYNVDIKDYGTVHRPGGNSATTNLRSKHIKDPQTVDEMNGNSVKRSEQGPFCSEPSTPFLVQESHLSELTPSPPISGHRSIDHAGHSPEAHPRLIYDSRSKSVGSGQPTTEAKLHGRNSSTTSGAHHGPGPVGVARRQSRLSPASHSSQHIEAESQKLDGISGSVASSASFRGGDPQAVPNSSYSSRLYRAVYRVWLLYPNPLRYSITSVQALLRWLDQWSSLIANFAGIGVAVIQFLLCALTCWLFVWILGRSAAILDATTAIACQWS